MKVYRKYNLHEKIYGPPGMDQKIWSFQQELSSHFESHILIGEFRHNTPSTTKDHSGR